MSLRSVLLLKNNRAWFVLIPFATVVLAWGPYIALNIINRAPWSFWRIPFVPIALYDSSAYFAWIGDALSGLRYGSHLSAFDGIVRVIGHLLPNTTSVAEVWLFTLWASVTAFVWIFARAISEWSGLSQTASRWFSVLVACSFVLPYFPRPGVFTWYIPFYAFGLLGVWRIQDALHRRAYVPALLWTAVSIGVSLVYPYFLIHIALWVGTLWFISLHERFRRVVRTIMTASILGVIPMIVLLTPRLLQPDYHLAFELKVRVGLAFTHLPVVSNSLFLVIAWTGFIVFLAFLFRGQRWAHDRLLGLAVGWMTLSASWLSNVLTGVYIHNDHFRAPAILFSWASLAVVYSVFSDQRAASEWTKAFETARRSRFVVAVPVLFFILSFAMFLLYVFKSRYVFYGDYLNVVHVSHWLALAAASLLVCVSLQRGTVSKRYLIAFAALAVALGIAARAFAFVKEMSAYRNSFPYVQTITWIRDNTKPEDGVCTDPASAEILGSFTGRLTYPTFATLVLPESDERIMHNLETELAYYDASAANVVGRFLDSTRGTTCNQFSLFSRFSSALGVPKTTFNAVAGCVVEDIMVNEERIRGFTVSRVRDDASFRELCRVVVVADDERSYWTLPADYKETKIDERFSAWRPTVQ